jgi:hypothetical protein
MTGYLACAPIELINGHASPEVLIEEFRDRSLGACPSKPDEKGDQRDSDDQRGRDNGGDCSRPIHKLIDMPFFLNSRAGGGWPSGRACRLGPAMP